MQKYIWLSDTHLNLSIFPLLKRIFLLGLNNHNADGIFLTGDISSGRWLEYDLKFLASYFNKPIYFVLGNHDLHGRFIESVHSDIRRISKEFNNLYWMHDNPIISLKEDVAIIGEDGWYDGEAGESKYLKYTSDWFRTLDFYYLDSFDQRIKLWKEMANKSAELVARKLEKALEGHKTVYILTHMPPWPEATGAIGTKTEKFWLPYNTNVAMGKAIEKVMKGRKKKRVIVLAGHCHKSSYVRISNTIECFVHRASYFGSIKSEEIILI